MSVDPLKSQPAPPSDAGRSDSAQAAQRAAARGDAAAAESSAPVAGDSVELSAASRKLIEQAGPAGEVPHGTVSADRMREVLGRLASGFYDRPEVQAQTARGLAKDLGTKPTE